VLKKKTAGKFLNFLSQEVETLKIKRFNTAISEVLDTT